MKRIITIFLLVSLSIQAPVLPGDYLAPSSGVDTDFINSIKGNPRSVYELLSHSYTAASLEMTDALADHAAEYLPDKQLHVFYPANRHDPAALLTAFRLIDKSIIESATFDFVYRLNFKDFKNEFLTELEKLNTYARAYVNEETENFASITLVYKQKVIQIRLHEGDPAEIIKTLPHTLNLIYFDCSYHTFSRRETWKKFINHITVPAAVFTYIYDAEVLKLVSDWYYITKHKFSNEKNYTGAVFGFSGLLDKEIYEDMWNAFNKQEGFEKHLNIPSEVFDRFIRNKALRICEGYKQDNGEGALLEKIKEFFFNGGTLFYEIGDETLFLFAKNMSPSMEYYILIHNAAIKMQKMGININQPYAQRIESMKDILYSDTLSLNYTLQLIRDLLKTGEKIDPSFIVNFSGKLSTEGINELKQIIGKHGSAEYKNKILEEAINRIKEAERFTEIEDCVFLLKTFGIKEAQELFNKNLEAQNKVFINYMIFMYRELSREKEPSIDLLHILINLASMTAMIDINRLLSYIQDPQSETEIISHIDSAIVEKIFFPVLVAVDSLERDKQIELTDAQKMTITAINDQYKRPAETFRNEEIAQEIAHESNKIHMNFLRDFFEGNAEALKVIDAMEQTPRHLFLPKYAEYWAYIDSPLYIGYGQTISQPKIVVQMLAQLALKKEFNVLEIGSGSGWAAAIMSKMAGEKGHVYAVEINEELSRLGKENLGRISSYKNITWVKGRDGGLGLPEHGPYDAVLFSCGVPDTKVWDLLGNLKPQVSINGRVVLPVVETHQTNGALYAVTKVSEHGYTEPTPFGGDVLFVPLQGIYGHEIFSEPPSRVIVVKQTSQASTSY